MPPLLLLGRVYGDVTLQSLTLNTLIIIIITAVQLMAASIISQGLS